MRRALIFVAPLIGFIPYPAAAQDAGAPDGFLSTAEIIDLLAFETFDDLHSLEDSNGDRIKPLHENTPFLAETYKDGEYGHYDDTGLSDRATYSIKDHTLCLTWTWTSDEKLESFNGNESCFYIERRGNCYLPQHKTHWFRPRPAKKIERTTFIFLKYGDAPDCMPKIS